MYWTSCVSWFTAYLRQVTKGHEILFAKFKNNDPSTFSEVYQGQVTDIEIQASEIIKTKKTLE